MKKSETVCDGCGKLLMAETPYPHLWWLHLRAEDHAVHSGVVFDLLMTPPINRDHDFCGLRCLADWAGKQNSKV